MDTGLFVLLGVRCFVLSICFVLVGVFCGVVFNILYFGRYRCGVYVLMSSFYLFIEDISFYLILEVFREVV